MPARIIDGAALAAAARDDVRADVDRMRFEHERVPGLAVIIVGEDPASQVYVRMKGRAATEAGIRSLEYRLPMQVRETEVLALLRELNASDDVDAILVQLPLPTHIEAEHILREIEPAKDVDGFHPENAGLLAIGQPHMVPCTPLGCVRLARSVHQSLRGLDVVVVGRSPIVGRPAAQLFLIEDCTVTQTHSATDNLPDHCRRADILVVAIGKPALVTGDWIKPGATVIDVGINRVVQADAKSRIVGDVDFESASRVAGALTPVPGGVGPMTVAMLLQNTLRCAQLNLAARARRDIA